MNRLPDGAARKRRAEDEALLRQPHVGRCGAHDAPDEEVQQDEEGDLQRQ